MGDLVHRGHHGLGLGHLLVAFALQGGMKHEGVSEQLRLIETARSNPTHLGARGFAERRPHHQQRRRSRLVFVERLGCWRHLVVHHGQSLECYVLALGQP